MIAVAGISLSLTPQKIGLRWFAATSLALFVVFAGNIIRMASSILVGVAFGTVSLVLFHDWVGSLFGFASVVVGWILLLRFQLPKYRKGKPPAPGALVSLAAGSETH
jgi:exosortase/archaeosortase family protein